jgi:hypothetical protein
LYEQQECLQTLTSVCIGGASDLTLVCIGGASDNKLKTCLR